ncbi:hypothetical protein NMD15_07120 [Plesiomonas shigelloides]|uniref:hypothetical protein n=1 Tax=Plesiomonas shigelloides TaxID=703 RepID=UPI00351D9DE1
MSTDNAASRLLQILIKGREIAPETDASVAWLLLFELNASMPNYKSLQMSKLGQVMLLPYETRLLMQQHYPSLLESVDYSLNQVQTAFASQNLSGSWSTFINFIDSHCISALSMVTKLLDHELKTQLIPDEKIINLKSDVNKILDETISSDLTSDFKRFMVHYLQKILNAINDYLISGAMPILDAIESTLGHAVLDPSFRHELADTSTGKNISKVLSDMANVVTIATAATGAALYLSTNGIPLIS